MLCVPLQTKPTYNARLCGTLLDKHSVVWITAPEPQVRRSEAGISILYIWVFCLFVCLFLAVSCGMQDLCSLPRGQTYVPCIESAES